MHKPYRLILAIILVVLLLWSFRTPRMARLPNIPPDQPSGPVVLANAHVAAQCGSLHGHVYWEGTIPEAKPFVLEPTVYTPPNQPPKPNPNRVQVHQSRVRDVVVYLQYVDPARSKPWSHSSVTIEADQLDLFVQQDENRRRIGFVQRGQDVQFVAREANLHSVRATGAMFFTQMLTDIAQPVRRTMNTSGVVELSSGSEFVWARCHLFIADHPYYTLTDEQGRYQFDAVPEGDYELVFWKPNWHIARQDRDPEYGVHTRLVYHPPVEQRRPVKVVAGQGRAVDNQILNAMMFEPKQSR